MANQQNCSVCGRSITGTYLTLDDDVFCSERCLQSTLPQCYSCGKPIEGAYMSHFGPTTETLHFCSRCSAFDPCSICHCPVDPALRTEYDGRVFCDYCYSTGIFTEKEFLPHWNTVLSFFRKQYGHTPGCGVTATLVDCAELQKVIGTKLSVELGFYRNRSMVKSIGFWGRKESSENCRIYVLSGIYPDRLLEVAVHEYAHDMMHHRYPKIRKLLNLEGFAEFIASEFNIYSGRDSRNAFFAKNPDPVYGNGYRLYRSLADKGGWDEIDKFLRHAD